jgi:hypothetical protein
LPGVYGAGIKISAMLIYNVTIQVEKEIAAQWLNWLLQEHIPELMSTGCFSRYQVVKLLDVDESEAITYAIQYYSASRELLDRYLNEHAEELRSKGKEKWGERFIAFRTTMEVVN